MWTFGGAGKRHEPREPEETRGNQRVLRNIGSHKPPFLPPPVHASGEESRWRLETICQAVLAQNAKMPKVVPPPWSISKPGMSALRERDSGKQRGRVCQGKRGWRKNDHVTQPGALTSSVPGSRSEASQVRVSSLATRTMCYWHHFVPPTYMHIQSDPYGVRTRCRYIVVLRGPPVAHNT